MFNYRRHLIGKPFRPFIMEVNSGASGQFRIPTTGGGYNYDVKTSDGQTFSGVTGNLTITFPSANTDYIIEISGEFPTIRINNNSERSKVLDIIQWGDIVWGSFRYSFHGCENMVVTATDSPILSNVSDVEGMFFRCTLLSNINVTNWIFSSISNSPYMFYECFNLNIIGAENLDMSNIINGDYMFHKCYLFDPNSYAPDLSSIVSSVNMYRETSLSGSLTVDLTDATDIRTMFYKVDLNELVILNMGNVTRVSVSDFEIPNIAKLICDNLKISFTIQYTPTLTGSAIDDVFTELGIANPSATVTLTTAQNTSGIDTTIATLKGWTIIVV